MWKYPDYYSQLENKPFTLVVAAGVRYLKLIYNRILKPKIELIQTKLFSFSIKAIALFLLYSANLFLLMRHVPVISSVIERTYKVFKKVSRSFGVFKEVSRSYFQKYYDLVFCGLSLPFKIFYGLSLPSKILTIFYIISVLILLPAIVKNPYLRPAYVFFVLIFTGVLSIYMVLSDDPRYVQYEETNVREKLTSIFYIINTWWRWGASKTSYVEPNIHNTLYLNRFLHAPLLETVWTIVPGIILIFIAIPSFALLYALDESFDAGQTIKVIGKQWYWRYEYFDNYYKMRAFDSYMLPSKELSVGAPRLLM